MAEIYFQQPLMLDNLHAQTTQHPFRCPNLHGYRTFLCPAVNKIPVCDECGAEYVEDTIKEPGMFLHTWTVPQAVDVLSLIPEDSFHWIDIAWNRVEYYAAHIQAQDWSTWGQYAHPIRFNGSGTLLTGAQRLLAIVLAEQNCANWTIDPSEIFFSNGLWVH